MTKLNTYLPLEVVMKSKKLQEIKTTRYTVIYPDGQKRNETGFPRMTDMIYVSCYPILSIADIIDNAEMLFGSDMQFTELNEEMLNFEVVANKILYFCLFDYSIQEISNYIIKNIK